MLLPDLLTRGELYLHLHARVSHAPPLLTDFDREVLLRLAADDAEGEGAAAPFRLRPGLLGAMLSLYDELRRRNRSVESFDRLARGRLEPGVESDRGAARLLEQTRFLTAAFGAFERRVALSGRLDEHGLRALLLTTGVAAPYRHVIISVADQAADAHGLWPADFDLLARLPGLQHVDLVVTEGVLATGLHERLHDLLPGLAEDRVTGEEGRRPTLLAAAPRAGEPFQYHFVCRDREEELVEAGRWLRHQVVAGRAEGLPMPLDRAAIVFQRPLPYLYLAREVLGSCGHPHQAVDALPLASEPFAAALDLIFAALGEQASRASIVELLGSPHWSFSDPAAGDHQIHRRAVAALDRVLREAKYLGGWGGLAALASKAEGASGARDAERWQLAKPALAAALAVASELEAIAAAEKASQQLDGLVAFVLRHERLPGAADAWRQRHARARAAVLGALTRLGESHRVYDDRPLPVSDLVATTRRWIEAQTFAPRVGRDGVLLLDVPAAAYAEVDHVRLVGLVESDWPERPGTSIFYPASVLRDLGWPREAERLSASRARFRDLLTLGGEQVSVSSFTLEEDAVVPPSPFLADVAAAGLAIERCDLPTPAPRMFIHEALDMEPVVADAVSGSARGWLQLRLSRTSPLDQRYRGSVGSREPATYAVSRIERYLACPFQYFAGHVLQLEEEREDESGLTPQERGQMLHAIFEAFFHAWRERGGGTITAEALDAAVALFAEVAEAHLETLPEADRALERAYLLGSAASPGLAERGFTCEIEHGVDVLERLVEYPIEGSFKLEGPEGVREVRLRGKADRIDLLADGGLRLIDYKLGRAPKPGRALQLPIYGVCAQQQLQGYRGRNWSLSRAGYVAFREKNPFIEIGGRSGSLEQAVRDGQGRFLEVIERIEAGAFPVDPDEPWMCSRCGFPHVCRKDYVGDE